MIRPPLPPFSREAALQVRLAEDGWNNLDADNVPLAFADKTGWRNRTGFLSGKIDVTWFLKRKWALELVFHLVKEMWSFESNSVAVTYAYEYVDDWGNWRRAYGNEVWEFADDGTVALRRSDIDEHPIREDQRTLGFSLSNRPEDFPGLSHDSW